MQINFTVPYSAQSSKLEIISLIFTVIDFLSSVDSGLFLILKKNDEKYYFLYKT